jgi:hypothetical protein
MKLKRLRCWWSWRSSYDRFHVHPADGQPLPDTLSISIVEGARNRESITPSDKQCCPISVVSKGYVQKFAR